MKQEKMYDNAQKLANDFSKKYPSIAIRLNSEQLLTAALMSTFTKCAKH